MSYLHPREAFQLIHVHVYVFRGKDSVDGGEGARDGPVPGLQAPPSAAALVAGREGGNALGGGGDAREDRRQEGTRGVLQTHEEPRHRHRPGMIRSKTSPYLSPRFYY